MPVYILDLMIKEIQCDIRNSGADVIIHACNCFHTMGTGVAKSLREKWPEVYRQDKITNYGDKDKLGSFSIAIVYDERDETYVLNCYTQYRYGRDKKYTDYEAYYNCLERVREFCVFNKVKSLAVPYKMGCNNAGGSWDICKNMINVVLGKENFDVLICSI